jgi:hypothetical protein
MKRWTMAAVITALTLVLTPAIGSAGTWLGGVKYWYVTWDSGIMDMLNEELAITYQGFGAPLDVDREPGTGYLAGPLLGYQSDDGKWSASIAPMMISSFAQNWSGYAGSMDLIDKTALDRLDVDIAFNYNLTDRYKLFAGLKYQDMELDFNLTTIPPGAPPQTDTYIVEAEAFIPTIGLGGVHPLGSNLVASGQIGILYAIQDMTITNESGDVDDIFPHPGLGFTTEVNMTYRAMTDLLLQLGYRYQVFSIKARWPGRTEIVESFDITQGLTLTAVYVF